VLVSLFLGEKITLKIAFALGLAVMGTALIVVTKSDFILHTGELKGDIIAMCAACFFAAYILYVRHARTTIGAGAFNFYMSLYCALFSLGFAYILGEEIWPKTPATWGYLLALGVFIQAIGQGLTSFALGKIPAGVGSIAMTFNAPISALASAYIFAEYLAPLQIIGGLMVIIALILVRPK
jgi:drug/metabolite transporter (DMT)-like permease